MPIYPRPVLRALRDADLPALVRLLNEVHPERLSSEARLRHRLTSAPARSRLRYWVAEEGGELVGWGVSGFEHNVQEDGIGFVGVGVHASVRGRGIGAELYEAAAGHLSAHGARRVRADAAEGAGRRFLEARAFRHTLTRRYSSIDPRSVEFSELSALEQAKAGEGFRIVPLAVFRERPQPVHAVDAATSRDIPFDAPLDHIPFDEWEREYWRHPDLTLDGSFAAVLNGRPVAFTMLMAERSSARALNEMTGTLAEFRGRGLARLVKLGSLRWAASHGITQVITENDETNAPMLAINERLGYRPFRSVFSYVLEPATG